MTTWKQGYEFFQQADGDTIPLLPSCCRTACPNALQREGDNDEAVIVYPTYIHATVLCSAPKNIRQKALNVYMNLHIWGNNSKQLFMRNSSAVNYVANLHRNIQSNDIFGIELQTIFEHYSAKYKNFFVNTVFR